METLVQLTDHGDGSADVTITVDPNGFPVDHRVSISGMGETAYVEYEESHYDGQFHTVEPHESVFKTLMRSGKVTKFLNENGYRQVRRGRR